MKKKYFLFIFGVFSIALVFSQHTAAQKTFVHPGIPFTQSDLNQLKANITQEPWLSGYTALQNDSKSKLSYTMAGPFATVTRSPDLNNIAWRNDMVAIHNLTFMYVFTSDPAYAAKATQILDAWAVTNTVWGGGENMLDIGDYVLYFVTAADILKSTYPGWTAANTTHVNNYFANVLYPASWVPGPLRDCNKGAIQLQIALSIAAFLDDQTKWNQALEVYRMDAGGGLRNSIASGQVGDTGRDDHWYVQAAALAWCAEVAYKQGDDMFAEMDNRLLAIGEYYNQYAINPSGVAFTPYGGYSVFWSNGFGIPTGARHQGPFNNIIKGAYSLRKGIPTPYTEQMRALVGEGSLSFLYLKSADNSTASILPPIVYPSESAEVSDYFTNIDIGTTGMKGNAVYNTGIWTVKGAGSAASNSCNFTFKPVKGDAAIVAKIENNSVANALSGLMIRESLNASSNYASINFTPSGAVNLSGAGQTAANSGYTHYATSSSWWLKLERVGNRVFAYHSPDAVHWTNIGLFITALPSDVYIGFYTASKNTSALNTALFSNVAVNNTFPAGSPAINSAVTAQAVLGSAFNFSITASGSPASYTASGLPAGLTVNNTSGVISGEPSAAGRSTVLLEASNANGTGKAALVIEVFSNQAPTAVNNLSAVSANSAIVLNWTATANTTSYTVKRSINPGGPYTIIQAGITGTTYTDPAPAYEVNNYYVVTASVGSNESTVSNEVFGSVPPAVPVNLKAINTSGKVELSWNTAEGAAAYKVKRGIASGGPYTEIALVTTNSYTDTAVNNGTAYYYVVSSKGNTSESTASLEVFGNPGTNGSTWGDNPAGNIFNNAAHWMENSIPASPAVLTFKNSQTNSITNDINGLTVSRIQFTEDAADYKIDGNSITLKSDLVNNSVQLQTLNMPVTLGGQLTVNAKTGPVKLNGVLSGSGSLVKSGLSALTVSGANTYSGNTIILGTRGYAYGSRDGIEVMGDGTGTSGAPLSGPLGKGKIIMKGGALFSSTSSTVPATLYNDIEIASGDTGYFYEYQGHLNLYGKLTGAGTIYNDGSDNYATISLYANNSGFTGTFITKLRSGNHRLAFMTPESGSANAKWLLDAQGVDCHRIMFGSGTLEFGNLSGRGGIRCNVAGTPIIRIGALNLDGDFNGTIANAQGTIYVEKIGTGTQIFTGNSTFGGTTSILNGTLLLNNSSETGTYNSPIIAKNGTYGGTGKSTGPVTVGTGTGSGAFLAPGRDGTVGILTTTGLATLNSDATYKVDLNAATGACDRLITAGAALNQTKLLFNIAVPGTLSIGTTLTILENTSSNPVLGTFKNLPEMAVVNISGIDFRITYVGGNGNDIQLLDERAVQTNGLADGMYYIKAYGTELMWTKTSSNRPVLGTAEADKNLQRWKIQKESNGKYKISSIGNAPGGYENYITQNADFGTQSYDISLNTLNIYRKAASYAVSGTANQFWYADGDKILASAQSQSEPSAFPFEIVLDIFYALDVKLEEAKLLRDVSQTSSTQETGKYPVAAKQSFINAIDGVMGQYNTITTAEQVNSQISILNAAINEFKKTKYYNLNQLANGNYYIKIPDSEFYWTKNSTNIPMYGPLENDRSLQTWNITKQSNGRYKITQAAAPNAAYQNYINEAAQFAKNAYDATWNTMNIYFDGTNYAIQRAQKAGVGFWQVSGNTILANSATSGIPESFPILLIPVDALQVITFNTLDDKYADDADFDPAASVNSNLPISYKSSNASVAAIVDGKIHITGAGSTVITAMQSGNGTFSPATAANQTLKVFKRNQSISFPDLPAKLGTDSVFSPGAWASSALEVNYASSNENVASIVDGQIHISGAGTAEITASQSGNQIFNPAASVTKSLTVNNIFYLDADQDGFGVNPPVLLPANESPAGYAINNLDCDDTKVLYADNDGDGLGSSLKAACGVSNSDDCDDTNPVALTSLIPDIYTAGTSQQKNTIFTGYSPASVNIKAVPSGGTAPYSYVWGTNQTTQAISISAQGIYSVVITDANGCQSSSSIQINTVNVQCGLANNKVQVCHNNLEVCLNPSAVQAHLNHGDKLGGCSRTPIWEIWEKVETYPNPVTTVLNIEVQQVYPGAVLEVYNILARKVKSEPLTNTSQVMSMQDLNRGVYFLHIKNGKHYTIKSIIKK